MFPFIARPTIDEAEQIADFVFNRTIELSIIVAERRRKLACWRAIKFAAVIRLENEDRALRGKRPRKMPLWRRRLRNATAECEANKMIEPCMQVACSAVKQQIAMLNEVDNILKRPDAMAALVELKKERELVGFIRSHVMSPEEREAQRADFAFGNLKIDRPDLTREDFDRMAGLIVDDEEDQTT